ncbi:hypothetical protein C2S52_015239 [Perilla frutescens var. hirtella]|nr:hypothetical protein C2S52_015239 [Perilla frutescens var. hirtella]
MLLNNSLLCFYPVFGHIKSLSYEKFKKPFLRNYENKSQLSRRIHCQSVTTVAPVTKGVGILQFFEGKNIFVTGATGLLGKVLVEKILRSTPVGKIYVLVKADDREAAMERLANELINSELFGCLQEKYGKYYQELIREKLIPVVGNICEPNLGIDIESARTMMEDINVIIESAAITTLNERYDLLVHTNVNGPQRTMSFAKSCKNLEILVHFSTVYVNGEKEGVVFETPLINGENRRNDTSSDKSRQLEIADDEITMALRSCTSSTNYEMTMNMKRHGMERARLNGWHNAYHMTKAMAEMAVEEIREDIPVLIIRPSVIESCYKEPIPGWIQGNRMYDPVIISYGKGQLPAYLGDPDAPVDIIPLDIVVNATIAAIAKHGQMHRSELAIYQIASSVVNPLLHKDFFDYLHEYFSSEPLIELKNFAKICYHDNVSKIKFFDNFDDFSNYTRQEIGRRLGINDGVAIDGKHNLKLQRQLKANVTYAQQLCKLYEFAGFYKARFHSGNVQIMFSEMSKEEQVDFSVDIKNIDWRKYFQRVHIPGLRKHVLNDKTVSV